MQEKKEWTVMFYFASDNPLASTIVSQLKAIKDAGFHQQVNVIAYFDPQPQNTPSHVFDVNLVEKLKLAKRDPHLQRFNFVANDPFVRNLVFDRLWAAKDSHTKESIRAYLAEKNKIDYRSETVPDTLVGELPPEQSLREFLTFCQTTFPARHYMLIILGHGVVVGNDIFLFDADIPDPEEPAAAKATSNASGAAALSTPSTDSSKAKVSKTGADNQPLPRHALTLKDLGDILGKFKEAIAKEGGQLEMLGLHSCSMSGLEVVYELEGTANYLLASQGPAFVGSWPYKQILIRLFNDLDPSFNASDFNSPTMTEVLNEPANRYLVSLFRDPTLLTQNPDTEHFRSALLDELNGLLDQALLCQSAWAGTVQKSAATESLMETQPQGTDLRWLNRMLLQDGCQNGFQNGKKKTKPGLKEMLIKMFYFCIQNSYDFQLAGYSFDMALCDLSKLNDEQLGVTAPLTNLSSALITGLTAADDSVKELIKGLILLAHWDAQSFFQEQYTDLYDFCLCLNRRSEAYQDRPAVNEIRSACQRIMTVLERGNEEDDKRLIVRSEFIGPAFQYSRGLSVFFPWSAPVDKTFLPRYEGYEISNREKFPQNSRWLDFLNTYFVETRRHFRFEEEGDSAITRKPNIEQQLLAVLQNISNSISVNAAGQLGSPLPADKKGAGDPTGDNCDCPSIKNYPSATEPGYKAPLGSNIAEQAI